MLVHCAAQPELKKDEGPIGLTLCPTRILVQHLGVVSSWLRVFLPQWACWSDFCRRNWAVERYLALEPATVCMYTVYGYLPIYISTVYYCIYVRIIYIYIYMCVCVCAYNQACQVSQKSLLHAGRCLHDLPCQESWRCRLRKRSTNSTSCWDSEAPPLPEDFPSTSSFAPSKAGEPPCFPKSLGWAESTWDFLPFSTIFYHVSTFRGGRMGK